MTKSVGQMGMRLRLAAIRRGNAGESSAIGNRGVFGALVPENRALSAAFLNAALFPYPQTAIKLVLAGIPKPMRLSLRCEPVGTIVLAIATGL